MPMHRLGSGCMSTQDSTAGHSIHTEHEVCLYNNSVLIQPTDQHHQELHTPIKENF
jgi:hypothetical protein